MRLYKLMLIITLVAILAGCQENRPTVCTAPSPVPVQRNVDGSYNQHAYIPPDCPLRRSDDLTHPSY